MAGLLDYLSTLGQAIMGNIPQQPQAPATPQQQGATPQSGGFMQGATNFLSNPLTQGALGAYFGAIGAPRRSGLGGMLSQGGLTGLNAFNQAETGRTKQEQEQLALQQAQLAAQQAAQRQQVFSGLSPQQQQVATFPSLASFQQKAAIQEANKQSVAAFQAMHPNDQTAAAFSQAYTQSDKYVAPGDIEKDYQEHLQAPVKQKETETRIAEQEAQTERLKRAPAAGTEANWYDPTTKQYYRGAQKKPTDVPASVAQASKTDQELKARAAAWQKAYADAKRTFIATNTKTESHYFSPATKTPPSEADADAYAKAQADAQVNALFGSSGLPSGAAPAASADEPAATGSGGLPPLPAGATEYAVGPDGATVGYHDSAGHFHPF